MAEQPLTYATPSRSVLERHFQSALQTVLVGLCGWMAYTVHVNSGELIRVNERIVALQGQIADLKAATGDRYTAAEAVRDFSYRDKRIDGLDARVTTLEGRVR